MRLLRPRYPLGVLCRVFEVSRSGYHAFVSRGPSKRTQDNARLSVAIQAAHVRTRQTYGPERLQDARCPACASKDRAKRTRGNRFWRLQAFDTATGRDNELAAPS